MGCRYDDCGKRTVEAWQEGGGFFGNGRWFKTGLCETHWKEQQNNHPNNAKGLPTRPVIPDDTEDESNNIGDGVNGYGDEREGGKSKKGKGNKGKGNNQASSSMASRYDRHRRGYR